MPFPCRPTGSAVPVSCLRFTAEAEAKKDWGALIGLFKKTTTLCLATSLLLMIIVFAGAPRMAGMIFQSTLLGASL